MKATLNASLPKTILTYGLLGLIVVGLIISVVVLTHNRLSFPASVVPPQIADTRTNALTLPVISTDNAPSFPNLSFSGEQGPVVETVGIIQIPNPDKNVTVLLAGLPGCAPCGFAAQNLSKLLNEYGTENLSAVFVDIYSFGGLEMLAWFANLIDATNLTWTIDIDGSFRERYAVAPDSILVMSRSGEILYRDNIWTPYETLRDHVGLALGRG